MIVFRVALLAAVLVVAGCSSTGDFDSAKALQTSGYVSERVAAFLTPLPFGF